MLEAFETIFTIVFFFILITNLVNYPLAKGEGASGVNTLTNVNSSS